MNNNLKKGLFFGVLVGLAWGLDTVLMGLVGNTPILSVAKSSTLISAFLHDGFCFVWLAAVMLFRKELGGAFRLLKSKKGKVAVLAAIIGAPIGMSGYVNMRLQLMHQVYQLFILELELYFHTSY